MYVQPLEGSLSPNTLASPTANPQAEGAVFSGAGAPATGDNISRLVPPWLNDGGGSAQYGDGSGSGAMQSVFGSLMGVLQQLMQMLQSLMGYGCNPPSGSGGCSAPSGSGGCNPPGFGPSPSPCPPSGNERFFQNASGSSEGDPHLSFDGRTWNNMTSQPNLLDSDSFSGGYRVSTQVTSPNDKGVTWNQSATVALNNGATTVTMNNDGQASITENGQSVAIARGQTLQLGNGESVRYEQNGSLEVTAQNGEGGRLQTTLTAEGRGVNVDVTAHDVDLGGTLVNGYERREQPPSPSPGPLPPPISLPITPPIYNPIPSPISGPVPTPIPGPFPVPAPIGEGPQPAY